MEYYKNYMADAVVRVDGDRRYFKRAGDAQEYEASNPDCKTTFGGEGYGVFYDLEPITKEMYDSFGVSWTFGAYQNILEPLN